MGHRVWGSQYRNTVVCIDSYEDQVPVGRIENPYLPEPVSFHGMVEFLKRITQMLDEMHLPQAFDELRKFPAPPGGTPEPHTRTPESSGTLATFRVNIIFRQNASWQGTVTWVDRGQEESFRSVLELINLLDSALSA